MKPIDHPDFFRFPAPAGRSRESSIVLDSEGRFFHDGERVAHAGLSSGLSSWIRRHPDNGRYILCNGYDWTYFAVEDVPFFVVGLSIRHGQPWLKLSDGSVERMALTQLRIGARDALYVVVKLGQFTARFTPSAQASLLPLVQEGPQGRPVLQVQGEKYRIEGA